MSELFRCRTRGTEYGFDYTLFGDLVPEKCRVMVHQTEVILSLAKQEKGMWSRLLKEKHKVSKHLSLPLSVFLSFCSPSHFFLSSVCPSEHQCINLSSVLFHVVHSLCCFFFSFFCGGLGEGGMSDNTFIYSVIHFYFFKFILSSIFLIFILPSIDSPTYSVRPVIHQSVTLYSHCCVSSFLLSSRTHLFSLSSHPPVYHIMHPLLCIFLSCFSFLHTLTYSVHPVIHWSITLYIHCCVSSCPVSPFFTLGCGIGNGYFKLRVIWNYFIACYCKYFWVDIEGLEVC